MRASDLVVRCTRVAAYGLVVSAGLLALGAREAHARATSAALGVGERLLDAPFETSGTARSLRLGDQGIAIAATQTALPLDAVLGRARAMCESNANAMAGALARLDETFAETPPAPAGAEVPGVGILADTRDGRGVVACFATGEPISTIELASRLERFSRSHDLADLGGLRYVAARTTETGATLVVATWTDGAFALDRLFPETGDAAGDDPKAAPRPAGARRILSARDEALPHGVFLYELDDPGGDALGLYSAELAKLGFVETPRTSAEHGARAFVRGELDIVVSVTKNEGASVTMSIVELASRKDTSR